MGYFSNGTEGSMYEEEFCARCIHGQDEERGCPIMGLHLALNYEECNKPQSIFHSLIPRSKDGLSNLQCKMFMSKDAARFLR